MRLLSHLALLMLAACAGPGPASSAAWSPGVAPLAVDLGGSSRIARIAGSAGEGEGYGATPVAPSPPIGPTPPPAMDHGALDHSKMGHGPAPTQVAQAAPVQGSGTLNSLDAAGRKVNLSHAPIPAIGWPAMTMDLGVAPAVDLRALRPGTRVDFTMRQGADGMYVIQSITAAGGPR